MAREFQNRSGSHSDAPAKSYRFDTAKHEANRRASSEVPVLFRLQNLQKSQDFSGATATAIAEKKSPELSTETKQQVKTASTAAAKATSTESVTAPVADSAVPAPNAALRSNSSRPWSTNVILLGIGFAVVGLLFKNSGSNSATVANNPAPANALSNTPANALTNTPANTPVNALLTPVASNPLQETAITSADSQTTKSTDLLVKTEAAKPEPSFSLEPLAAPKLPDPMVLSIGNEAGDAVNPSFDTKNSGVDDLDFANSAKGFSESPQGAQNTSIDESLSLGTPSQSSPDFNQTSLAPRSSSKSVAIPNSVTGSEPTVEPEFNQTNFANGSTIINNEKTSSGSTVITNPHVVATREPTAPAAVASSQIISTSTPELETEELFKLRTQHNLATMESQQQAMAMGRQPMTPAPQQQQATAQWNPATGTFGPNATMVSGQTQSRPAYIAPTYTAPAVQSPEYNYQPVQAAPQGYGAPPVYGAPQTYRAPQAYTAPQGISAPANIPTTVSPPQSAPAQNAATATAPASVRQPYVPISGSFNPERFGLAENALIPNQQTLPPSGQNSTPVPVSGGYQPLSPQFQYQPANGN